jgi:hypothetical protein
MKYWHISLNGEKRNYHACEKCKNQQKDKGEIARQVLKDIEKLRGGNE